MKSNSSVRALVASAFILAATTGAAIAGCAPTERAKALETALAERICPVKAARPDTMLGAIMFNGDVDPDLAYLAEVLHRLSGVHPDVEIDPMRLEKVLRENENLRTGLQALIVAAVFREEELEAWCAERSDGYTSQKPKTLEDVRRIRQVIRCGLPQ